MTNLINENTALNQATYQNSKLDRKKTEKPTDSLEIFQKKKETEINSFNIHNAYITKLEMDRKYGTKIEEQDLNISNLNIIA